MQRISVHEKPLVWELNLEEIFSELDARLKSKTLQNEN